jgi:hypothetical protein
VFRPLAGSFVLSFLLAAGLKMQRYEDMLTSPATVSFFAGIKQWLLRFI